MGNIPTLEYINERIDLLTRALVAYPDRADLKLRLSMYLALKRKVYPDSDG